MSENSFFFLFNFMFQTVNNFHVLMHMDVSFEYDFIIDIKYIPIFCAVLKVHHFNDRSN